MFLLVLDRSVFLVFVHILVGMVKSCLFMMTFYVENRRDFWNTYKWDNPSVLSPLLVQTWRLCIFNFWWEWLTVLKSHDRSILKIGLFPASFYLFSCFQYSWQNKVNKDDTFWFLLTINYILTLKSAHLGLTCWVIF